MDLELDAGNTRIKWRLRERGVTVAAGAEVGVDGLAVALEPFWDGIVRALIVSVRVQSFNADLELFLKKRLGLEPCYATVSRSCAGVTTACTDISRLGVDRWLALLAAWRIDPGYSVIIDCGTAVTMDIVDENGLHPGGYIVPGLAMQKQALLDNTGIRFKDAVQRWGSAAPGVVTEEAVYHGIFAMLTSWLVSDTAVRKASEGGRLYLTGGDAILLQPVLERSGLVCTLVPDLVMDGLALACENDGGGAA